MPKKLQAIKFAGKAAYLLIKFLGKQPRVLRLEAVSVYKKGRKSEGMGDSNNICAPVIGCRKFKRQECSA